MEIYGPLPALILAGALARWRAGALARWRAGALARWRAGALAHTYFYICAVRPATLEGSNKFTYF
jgi:hypothetical protein